MKVKRPFWVRVKGFVMRLPNHRSHYKWRWLWIVIAGMKTVLSTYEHHGWLFAIRLARDFYWNRSAWRRCA